MLQSRRSLLYQANSFIRSNPLTSISHKNQVTTTTTSTTPEEFSKVYNRSEVDSKATRHDVVKGDRYDEQRETTAETAKAAAAGAMDAGLELGKVAKKTVDGMLDAAENVRDSLTDGDGDDRVEERSSDKFVEDLRRRANGYDRDDRR
ncbi:uncharacterized protein LOC131017838 isoform X2 [Salvia miltiorrhiza]|uniref:uncharacterized protein LOC131017838 isoform X2 n=1 Tax=Salvia miltiorrhiza TaxID=226208 RepID=UPI0025AC3D48|nr:uncharacterized protein LOC131017838 isoform X2 [Salvia miltiorrhiza]